MMSDKQVDKIKVTITLCVSDAEQLEGLDLGEDGNTA